MGEIYGGHLVAKYLKEIEGVDTVFGLVGGHITGFLMDSWNSELGL